MSGSVPAWDPSSLAANERVHVRRVLIECKWNKAEAARRLGVNRRKLYRLMMLHRIKDLICD